MAIAITPYITTITSISIALTMDTAIATYTYIATYIAMYKAMHALC